MFINGNQQINATPSINIPAADSGYTTIGALTDIIDSYTNQRNFTTSSEMSEIMMYNAYLTDAQRQQIEGYLAWKWRLIPRFQNPTSIPGCTLWLDAADSNTVVTSGSTVTQWRDKSGIGNHTTSTSGTSTYTSNAINGTPAILMGSSYFTGSFASTYTGTSIRAFAVATMNNASGHVYGRILSLGRPGVTDYGDQTTLLPLSRAGGQNIGIWRTGISTSVNVPAYDTPFLVRSANVGSNISIAINGGSDSTVSAGTSVGFNITHYCVGANVQGPTVELYGGYIGEIICYTSVLTTAQIQQVEGYLADKWRMRTILPGSFPSMFPASHPFYRSLPYTRAFNPLDIAGCTLWLDGADGGAMTLSGSNVEAWLDKSGNSRHATQTTSGLRPTYTSNFINFNGASYLNMTDAFNMLSSTGRHYTTFILERRRAAGGGQFPLAGGGSTGGNMMAIGYNADTVWRHTYATISDLDYTIPAYGNPDPLRIWSAGYNGALRDTYLNGVLGVSAAYSSGMTDWVQPVIGYIPLAGINSYYTGEIYEILFYNSYLSTLDRQRVERYLAWKWGFESLPTFTPTSITGCQLWLDAADSSTFTLSGSNVTQWRDKSGTAFHFSTTAGTPTYASRTVTVPNGAILTSSSALSLTDTTYIYVVSRVSSIVNGSGYLMAFGNISGGDFSIRFSENGLIGTAAQPGNADDFAAGNYYVNGVFNPSAVSYSTYTATNLISGKSFGRSDRIGSTVVTLSSSFNGRYFIGNIYEVLIYSSVPTTTQRQQVESYLARKWGISSTAIPVPPAIPSLEIPPRVPALEPPQLSNLALWLDAADTGCFLFSGSNVASWSDKSSNGLAMTGATPPTYISDALNGRPVVSFTTAQSLSSTTPMTLSPSNTWALVFNSPTGGNFFMTEHSSNINNVQGSYFLGANFDLYAMNRTGVLSTWKRYQDTSGQGVPPFNTNTWYIAIVSDNNANGGVFFRRNGVTRTISNVNAFGALTGNITSNFFINHRLTANVNIAEMLVYNRGLSLAEVQTLEGYLASKWGLLGSLPSSHPYVKIAP
jgi:hypothetical protein